MLRYAANAIAILQQAWLLLLYPYLRLVQLCAVCCKSMVGEASNRWLCKIQACCGYLCIRSRKRQHLQEAQLVGLRAAVHLQRRALGQLDGSGQRKYTNNRKGCKGTCSRRSSLGSGPLSASSAGRIGESSKESKAVSQKS